MTSGLRRCRVTHAGLLPLLLAACAAAPASPSATPSAAGPPERWTATSTTSVSITGDVTFQPGKVTFQNGRSLALARIGPVADFKTLLGTVPATLYRVTPPADPVLENDNRLCGQGRHSWLVTFVVIWRPSPLPGDVSPRMMDTFSGRAAPGSEQDAGFCGSFAYDRRGP
ncbi:MAG: hypothetical protein KGL52_17015 [Rhodospirillales bacterium]|jgi:hypothetical protein|nr:hypothetical protein [Rhodospirillales bacterium]